MADRDDLLRVDQTGTVHPVGRSASQQLRARAGEWRLLPSPRDLLLFRKTTGGAVLKLAGEIFTPGALCDVVALVAQSNWKGELVVLCEAGTRTMYFDQGNVIGAATNVAEERLGEMLYQFGVITREQLDTIVQTSTASGKRIGESAIELGFVSAEEMYPMMAKQVEAVFYAALRIGDGTFFFFDRFDEKAIGRRHNLNAGGLLMEGARRMDEMKFFREKIPSEHIVPVPNAAGKKIPEELQAVFAQCDGKRSIADIGRRIGELEFEVTKAVFQLLNAGLVQAKTPRPEGPEAIVEAFNPPLLLMHETCDRAGKGNDLREGLSRFATGGGIYDPLFMAAGPLPDGTFKPERVANNIAALAGDDPDSWITQLMMDYVGFGLFHSESLLPREAHQRLTEAVSEMLKPLQNSGVQSGVDPAPQPAPSAARAFP
jgi:hypothetical protein